MLVLTRRLEEGIKIGADIEVKVIEINKHAVRLGIIAPREVSVHRKEIYELIQSQNIMAARNEEQTVSVLKNAFKKVNKEKNN